MEPAKLVEAAIGIAFVTFLVWKLFPSPLPLSLEIIEENFLRCFPDALIQETILSDDQKTGILLLGDRGNSFGLAHAFGDKCVCRWISGQDLDAVSVNETEVKLVFSDFTLPQLSLKLSGHGYKTVRDLLETIDRKGPAHAA